MGQLFPLEMDGNTFFYLCLHFPTPTATCPGVPEQWHMVGTEEAVTEIVR